MNTIKRILLAGGLLGIAAASGPAGALAQRSGVEVWAQTCGNCHVIQPARRYTADQWASIMTHMKIASRMTDAEADAVLRFLQRGARKLASSEPVTGGGRATPDPLELAALDAAAFLATLQATPADGARLYSKECKACHGARGKGDGRAGRTMDPKPSDISDPEYLASTTDEELAQVIVEGKGEMDPFGDEFTEEQIRALVTYMRRLGELRQKPKSP